MHSGNLLFKSLLTKYNLSFLILRLDKIDKTGSLLSGAMNDVFDSESCTYCHILRHVCLVYLTLLLQ